MYGNSAPTPPHPTMVCVVVVRGRGLLHSSTTKPQDLEHSHRSLGHEGLGNPRSLPVKALSSMDAALLGDVPAAVYMAYPYPSTLGLPHVHVG